MENQDQDLLLLESVSHSRSTDNDTAVSSEPEQEQKDGTEPNLQPESNQETQEARTSPLALIEFRIEQLLNRRFLLLKMQRFMKKAEDDSNSTTEEMTCEDRDELCELDTIQKELEELMVKKETLEKRGKITSLKGNEGQLESLPSYKSEAPRGGIYTLPPPQLSQENVTLERKLKPKPAEKRPSGPILPVDSLGQMSAITRCPRCEEIVCTDTTNKGGETMWMLCCLCSIMGCFAGCCLIPFFIDRIKNVQHRCPHCQELIHTYRPF